MIRKDFSPTSPLALQRLHASAAHGLVVWLTFAAVEYFFVTVLEMAYVRTMVLPGWHWRLNLLAFTCYAAAGLLTGAAAEFAAVPFLRRVKRFPDIPADRLRHAVLMGSLLLAFCSNVTWNYGRSGLTLFVFLISASVALAALVSLGPEPRASRTRFLASPATAGILLFGTLWTVKALTLSGRLLTLVVAALFCAAVGIVAFLVAEIRRKWRGRMTAPTLAGALMRMVPVVLILFGAAWLLDRWVRSVDPKFERSPVSVASPNVIVLVWDTVRADHVSAYGYHRDTTPNLARLAQQATLYRNAIAAANYTLPSHASLFTGLYPSWHGVTHMDRQLDPKLPTLAEILGRRGYRTAEVSANPGFLSAWYGLNRGFQYTETFRTLPFLAQYSTFWLRTPLAGLFSAFAYAELSHWTRPAEDVNRSVFRVLDALKDRAGPFFLFVNYFDAHSPQLNPPPFDSLYPGRHRSVRFAEVSRAVMREKRRLTETERRHLASQYDGGIAYLDFELGKLLARLKGTGMYDNSLLIVTADHGEALGDRGLVGHYSSLYQDQVHVPLVIKYPGAMQRAVVDEAVSLVDLFPTVLDALGAEAPKDVQGRSLFKLKPHSSADVISESVSSRSGRGPRPSQRALYRLPLKLIVSTTGTKELYDLSNDPNETANLYAPDHEAGQVMAAALDAWIKRIPNKPAQRSRPDRKLIEQLRGLGYLQ